MLKGKRKGKGKGQWQTPPGKNGPGGKGKGFQGECWLCGEFGHSAKNCPHPPKGRGKGIKEACWDCGEKGHRSIDCPHPQGKGQGGGIRTVDNGENENKSETNNQDGSFSVMPTSVRSAMTLGGYIRMVTTEPSEAEMVDMLMKWFPRRVSEYAGQENILEYQAAEEMIEGYVMSGEAEAFVRACKSKQTGI